MNKVFSDLGSFYIIVILSNSSRTNSSVSANDIFQYVTDYEYDYNYEYDYDINDSLLAFNWLELEPCLCVYNVTFCGGILGNILMLVAFIRNTQLVKCSQVNVFSWQLSKPLTIF